MKIGTQFLMMTLKSSQNGTASSIGNAHVQTWVQGAIAKINTSEGTASSTPNAMTGPSFMPISINTGTFPGTPARTNDTNPVKSQPISSGKVLEETNILSRPASGTKLEESQSSRVGQLIPSTKVFDESPGPRRPRFGSGNAGQGYTSEEVKVLFLILVDLCKRTAGLQHPLPASQVGVSNANVSLHYIDGNYTVLPEVVEASLGPHMQNMPRPRGADAAGLLLRELELHPPSEEWHKRNMFGGPWSDLEETGPLTQVSKKAISATDTCDILVSHNQDNSSVSHCLWPRKRRMSERDAAFGLKTSVGTRDVVTAVWRTGLEGVWHKCIRCLRQTSAFASPNASNSSTVNEREAWWISRWDYGCPMCGGTWVRFI